MRVVLSGSKGRIGRVVATHLVSLGHNLIEVDRDSDGAPCLVRGFDLDGDFDAFIHLAANAWSGHHAIQPRFEEVEATTAAIEFCERHTVNRLIFASSMEMEPSLGGLGVVNQASYYKATKAYGEALCGGYAARHPKAHVVGLRLGGYYPDEPFMAHSQNNVVRLSDQMIRWWIDRSIEFSENFAIWLAIGPGEFKGVEND